MFSQRGDLESCGDLSWEHFSDKPEDLSDRESEAWVVVPVAPNVTDVLGLGICGTAVLIFLQKACSLYGCVERDDV